MDPKEQKEKCEEAKKRIQTFLSTLGVSILLLDTSNLDTSFESMETLGLDPEQKETLTSYMVEWYATCEMYKHDTRSPRDGRIEYDEGKRVGGGRIEYDEGKRVGRKKKTGRIEYHDELLKGKHVGRKKKTRRHRTTKVKQ